MNLSKIEIHEFSTGIHAERVGTGWVSRGFTGEYMNRTLDPIPVAVQQAIRNREFAVAEGASSDEPAVIGREISDNGEEWSVIAVVTKGRDDRGRSASMYRYFLCKEIRNLGNILAWMYRQQTFPIFDPYDTRIIENPAVYQNTGSSHIKFINLPLPEELPSNPTTPIIVPWQEAYTPIKLNEIAIKIPGNQLISWAFKVEALEQPTRFQVIQPASEKAEQLLRRITAITPQHTVNISGEHSINSAIKGFSSREQVKIEQILILENALNDPQVTKDYWESLFNSAGVAKARSQGIYIPQMVRLLTLQAILIPEMLPGYLIWMSKRGKQDDHYQTSENFQTEIRNALSQLPKQTPNLINNLIEGVTRLIPTLVDQSDQVEVTAWLLQLPDGLWSWYYSKVFIPNLEHDLNLMQKFASGDKSLTFKLTSHPEWNQILGDISDFWRSDDTPNIENYEPLADLFEKLEDQPKLAALFSHIAYGKGEVNKRIFSKIPSKDGWHSKVYGVKVERKVTFLDILFLVLLEKFEIGEEISMRVGVAVAILLVTFSGGLAIGRVTAPASQNTENEESSSSQSHNLNPTTEGGQVDSPNQNLGSNNNSISSNVLLTNKLLETAFNNFDDTKQVIKSMIDKIAQDESTQQDKVILAIKKILSDESLQYSSVILNQEVSRNEEEKKWIEAIYLYQKSKNEKDGISQINIVGYLIEGDLTDDHLKKDIKKELKQN